MLLDRHGAEVCRLYGHKQGKQHGGPRPVQPAQRGNRPEQQTGRHQIEHPPAGPENAAEVQECLGQRQLHTGGVIVDLVADGKERKQQAGQRQRPVAAPPRPGVPGAADRLHHADRQRGGQERQDAQAEIIKPVILPRLLGQRRQKPGPGIAAPGAGVPQGVEIHGEIPVSAAGQSAAAADGSAEQPARQRRNKACGKLESCPAPPSAAAAPLHRRQQGTDHDGRQKVGVNPHCGKRQQRKLPRERFPPCGKRLAVFQIEIEGKKNQPLAGQRGVAERPLPQCGQHTEEQRPQQRESPALPDRTFRGVPAAEQRPRCPLQGKAGQRIPAEPLEGGRQRPAQQFKKDADPGKAVGVGNHGSVRHGDGIGHAQRQGPVGIAKEHPARVVLLNVPFIVAVENPGVVAEV